MGVKLSAEGYNLKIRLIILSLLLVLIAPAIVSGQILCTDDVFQCPDGSFVGRDPNNNCQFFPCSFCGDGTVDVNEACDDGNSVNGDGCSSVCELETFCQGCTTVPIAHCNDLILMNDTDIMALGFDNVIRLSGGTPDHIAENSGRDIVFGTSGVNIIRTGDGNDYVCAFQGNDIIHTGAGNDVIFGGNGNDNINSSFEHDFIDAGSGHDTVDAFGGNDCIHGDVGNDNINAGSGHDRVTGNSGSDTIDGGIGNDLLVGGISGDTINGGSGADQISGDGGNDILSGGQSSDQIDGGPGADTLNGNGGADDLQGGQGADTINGGSGSDTADNDPADVSVTSATVGAAPLLSFSLDLSACFPVYCGDGVVQQPNAAGINEACDDGNDNNFDSCRNDCTLPLVELPVMTCTGEGELLLYQGDNPFQTGSKSFVTEFDELLFFTTDLGTINSVKVNNVSTPLNTFFSVVSPFDVQVSSIATTPGDLIEIDAVTARQIQGYLAQNNSNPVFNSTNITVLFDESATVETFLKVGDYDFVIFDKYTNNTPNSGNDTRTVEVMVDGPTGNIFSKVYDHPFPSGVQGAITESFTVTDEGNHSIHVDDEDSVYFPLIE